jgi:cytohesin
MFDWEKANPGSMPNILDCNNSGITPLHLACLDPFLESAELLLGFGFDVNTAGSGPEYHTPLAWVVRRASPSNNICHILTFLLSRGAHVDGRTIHTEHLQNFDTPLHHAISNKEYQPAKILIENGASLTAFDNMGAPALHGAARQADFEMVKLIVNKGGNANAVDAEGLSVVHILAIEPYNHFFSFGALWFLRGKGADMFLENNAGKTPRELAVETGWPEDQIQDVWGP